MTVFCVICWELAVVIKETDGFHLKFLEVAARNTGTKLKLFSDVDRAYKWLGIEEENHAK